MRTQRQIQVLGHVERVARRMENRYGHLFADLVAKERAEKGEKYSSFWWSVYGYMLYRRGYVTHYTIPNV